MRMPRLTLVGMAALACAMPLSAAAAAPSYMGAWTLTGAVKAPWADPVHPLDPSEPSRLIGKAVVFKAGEIDGPRSIACQGARYAVKDYTADLLFQGAFGEMRLRDKRVDPAKIAASLGFTGPTIKTLETGCEIDFHFVNEATAEIGLNDHVYTLKKRTLSSRGGGGAHH